MYSTNRVDDMTEVILNVTDTTLKSFNVKDTNMTDVTQEYLWLRCLDAVVTSIFFLIGLLGNSFIIYIFTNCPTLKKPQNVFIISLALTDLLIAVPHPITALTSVMGYDILGDTLCDVTASVTSVGCLGSMINIAVLALCRYIIVIYEGVHQLYITWRSSITVCFLLQIYILLVVSPIWAGWSAFRYLPPMYLCVPYWQINMNYTYFLFTMVFMLPGILMAFCHFRIYKKYKSSQNKVKALRSQGIAGRIKMHEFRLTLQLGLIFVIYTTCWTPCILLTVFIDPEGKLPIPLYIVVRWVTCFNGIINIFVYFHFNHLFRTECMQYIEKYCKCCLKLKICRKQDSQESDSSDIRDGGTSAAVRFPANHTSTSLSPCLEQDNCSTKSTIVSSFIYLKTDKLDTIPEIDI